VRCAGGAGERHVWAGVTGGGTTSDLFRLFFGGEGLGIMTGAFNGRMMTKDEVLSERRFHRTSGRAERIRFLVSPAACERVLTFYDEFVRAELYRSFGLEKRPRWREGAGCTTFVLSLAEVAGIKVPDDAWSTSVRVPKTLIGDEQRSVGVFEILYGDAAQRWAAPAEDGVDMRFFDVSKIEAWLRALRAKHDAAAAAEAFGLAATFDDEGMTVNARAVPMPADPLFRR
jgi:hypothetical protein